jgi:hypothetical protein
MSAEHYAIGFLLGVLTMAPVFPHRLNLYQWIYRVATTVREDINRAANNPTEEKQ